MTSEGQKPASPSASQKLIQLAGWIFLATIFIGYAWRMVGIGLDLRQDLWVFCAQNHLISDINNALDKGGLVLREAQAVAQEDEEKQTLAQREQRFSQIAAGHPPATIERPGPGLFDSPFNAQEFSRRWRHLSPVYGQIIRGWVRTYEHLLSDMGESADYDLDYPPMRLMVMTLWTWRVQTHYPGITAFPQTPQRVFDPETNQSVVATGDIIQPMVKFNAFCEGVTSVSIFILVWLWMERPKKSAGSRMTRWLFWPRNRQEDLLPDNSWRSRWGDPLLLAPVIVFGICTLFRSNLSWQMPLPDVAEMSPIDVRVTSIGWWIFLVLRFLSAVCLARFLPRPFRAPSCALVAATMAWLNPGSILDSSGWPQWDTWLPPFFLVAAILITLDWWIAAGLLLGVGCMFKGQLLFVAPVLVLCPLFAGWPGRFLRIVAGMAAGAGLIVWPWLVTNVRAERWLFVAMLAAAFCCAISLLRGILLEQCAEVGRAARDWWSKFAEEWSPQIATAMVWMAALFLGALLYLALRLVLHRWIPSPAVLLGLCVVIVPWLLPRRLISAWLLFVFASALLLVAVQMGGSWSWWKIGFVYGTQKHHEMQLGANSLSNLSSILAERFSWQLHDQVGTLNLPWIGTIDLDTQGFLAWIYFATALMCAAAAAMQMRRRDPRFLIVLAAPWVLFTALLTQMTARYMVLPAVIASSLVGISVEMSLLAFLQTVLACTMLGNQMISLNASTSPVALSITQPTYPDIAWVTMLVAAIFLYSALTPSRRTAHQIEVV
jgi:hypothetical protein